MSYTIEEPSSWWATSNEIIFLAFIDSKLPEMIIFLRNKTISYPAEFTAYLSRYAWLDSGMRMRWT
jgi:hypothetical protein